MGSSTAVSSSELTIRSLDWIHGSFSMHLVAGVEDAQVEVTLDPVHITVLVGVVRIFTMDDHL